MINLVFGRSAYYNVLASLFKTCFDSSCVFHIVDRGLEGSGLKGTFTNMSDFLDCHSIKEISGYQIAIGNHYGYERLKIFKLMQNHALEIEKLWHDSSLVLDAFVQPSTILMPRSTIMPYSQVGHCCIINTGATLDHDCKVGDGCHLMGNTYVAGKVSIGSFSTIGSNSTIFPGVKIGVNCFIGAGAVVREDVPDNTVVAGVPAKTISMNRSLGEKVGT